MAIFLWPGYNARRPGCMSRHFLNQSNAHKANLLHELVCDKISALVSFPFFGGTVSNKRISSKDAAMVRIGRRESRSDQPAGKHNKDFGSESRFMVCSVHFKGYPSKSCFIRAFDSNQRRQIKPASLLTAKVEVQSVEENLHHLWPICGKRGDVATKDMLSTCVSTISALSVSVIRIIGRRSFCGPNIMLSSLWVCFWFTVYKWHRMRSANILLHGNGMIFWTVYKL